MQQAVLSAVKTPVWRFSRDSTESVPNSLWFCSDFILGAGTVIIQPATGKVVLLYNPDWKIWFLPKGRKDVGESLEQTALREAFEESGYRAQFLPLDVPTRAPSAPVTTHFDVSSTSDHSQVALNKHLNTEPIYIGTHSYKRTAPENGGEYITFWYAAFIGPDAIREENTGMADEKHFQTYLMSPEEAMGKLVETGGSMEANVVRVAYKLWLDTEKSVAQRT